jgi:hypothetical protein
MFQTGTKGSPIRFFLEPVAIGLNHLKTQSRFLPELSWGEIELSAEEQDAAAVVLETSEATRVGLNAWDLRV